MNDPNPKLFSTQEMGELVREYQSRGQTVVMANGIFDLLHVGHIRYLTEARSLGDALLVAVNDDQSTRAYKGEGRPHTPLAERLEILAALECVDYLTVFGDPTADALLLAIRPDIQAKGTDYTLESVPERATVLSYGGRIAICGDAKNHSSTELIEKLDAQRKRENAQ